MSPPDFIILGGMRCGSTSLWRYLSDHPDVFMAPKELGYFTERYEEGRDWYEGQFATALPGQKMGEATADYLARTYALERIARDSPDSLLVAILRHPADRAWSHYWLLRERGREKRTFDEVLEYETELRGDPQRWAEEFTYLRHGAYDQHLQALLSNFSREQLHVVILEEFTEEPEAEFGKLCRFIGVDATQVPDVVGTPVNQYVSFRSLRLRDWAKSKPKWLSSAVALVNNRPGASYGALSADQASILNSFYEPHILGVEEILGRPIQAWRVPTA